MSKALHQAGFLYTRRFLFCRWSEFGWSSLGHDCTFFILMYVYAFVWVVQVWACGDQKIIWIIVLRCLPILAWDSISMAWNFTMWAWLTGLWASRDLPVFPPPWLLLRLWSQVPPPHSPFLMWGLGSTYKFSCLWGNTKTSPKPDTCSFNYLFRKNWKTERSNGAEWSRALLQTLCMHCFQRK